MTWPSEDLSQGPRSKEAGFSLLEMLVVIAILGFTRAPSSGVATHTDANLVATTYVRNGWGEVIRETSPDIGTVDYVRNKGGRIAQKTDGRGVVATYGYDAAGRLTTISYPGSTGENVAFGYDAVAGGNKGVGRLTSVTDESGSTAFLYDGRDELVTAMIGARTNPVHYDYDAAGRLAEVVYPSGRRVNYAFDAAGRPTAITTRKSAADSGMDLATAVLTQPFSGMWKRLTHRNGLVDARELDEDGRVAAYRVSDGVTNRLDKALRYADGMNLTSVLDRLDPAEDENYGYGAANRLETTRGPWGNLDFASDAVANRTYRERIAPGVNEIDAYTLQPGTNRIAAVTSNGTPARSFTYDRAGNILTDTKGGVTTTYSYNHAGRLASLTVGGSGRGPYRYNGFGLLASRQMTAGVPASTVHLIYDFDGNLIAEADASTGLTRREYIWFAGRPLAAERAN